MTIQDSRVFLWLCGPSGAGKDTILSLLLLAHDGIARIPRVTTRPRRLGETAYDIRCMNEDEFAAADLAAVVHTNGFSYGIDPNDITAALDTGNRWIVSTGTTPHITLPSNSRVKVVRLLLTASRVSLEDRLFQRGHTTPDVWRRMDEFDSEWSRWPTHFPPDHVLWTDRISIDETFRRVASHIGLTLPQRSVQPSMLESVSCVA